MKKLGFGLIGCGRIASVHADCIKSAKQAELVAVTDIVSEKSDRLAEKFNSESLPDNKELIAREDIDVVSICTPNGTHPDIASQCLSSGKHVVLEKPVAISQKGISILEKASQNSVTKIFPVKQVRHIPAVVALKELLESGSLGKIYSLDLTLHWSRNDSYFSGWRGTRELDGSILLNQGIHYLDLLQWLFGEVKSVSGKTRTLAHKIEMSDSAFAVLSFAGGALGTVTMNLNEFEKNRECSLSLCAENASIKIGGNALNKVEYWEVTGLEQKKISQTISPKKYSGGYEGSCPYHFKVYENVLNDLLNSSNDSASLNEAISAVNLALAIEESSSAGKEINLQN